MENSGAGPRGNSFRTVVSLCVVFGFVWIALSGLIMLFGPHGRGASSTILGLGRGQWKDVHLVFSLFFIVASCLHIYCNWASLTAYFARPFKGGHVGAKALGVACTLMLVVLSATLLRIPPATLLLREGPDGPPPHGAIGPGGPQGPAFGQQAPDFDDDDDDDDDGGRANS